MIIGLEEDTAVVTAYKLGCAINTATMATLTEDLQEVEVTCTCRQGIQTYGIHTYVFISQTFLEAGSTLIARSKTNTGEAQVRYFAYAK